MLQRENTKLEQEIRFMQIAMENDGIDMDEADKVGPEDSDREGEDRVSEGENAEGDKDEDKDDE
jgi:hypothetical protein